MARITSVMAGLACALALCLAYPVAAAPADHLIFDSGGGLELMAVAPAPAELGAIVDVFELTAPMLDVAATDPIEMSCPDGAAWVSLSLPGGGPAAELLPGCHPVRHYDPGWPSE